MTLLQLLRIRLSCSNAQFDTHAQVSELVPSQILWINIPAIDSLHWHPVSIAHTQPDDPRDPTSSGMVTVHFKAYGAWTKVGCLYYAILPNICTSPSHLFAVS